MVCLYRIFAVAQLFQFKQIIFNTNAIVGNSCWRRPGFTLNIGLFFIYMTQPRIQAKIFNSFIQGFRPGNGIPLIFSIPCIKRHFPYFGRELFIESKNQFKSVARCIDSQHFRIIFVPGIFFFSNNNFRTFLSKIILSLKYSLNRSGWPAWFIGFHFRKVVNRCAFEVMTNLIFLLWKLKSCDGKELPNVSFLKILSQYFQN